LNDQNARVIAAICRRLDGVPLEIELAAARTDDLSLVEIERDLANRFELLKESDPVVGEDRSVKATLEWSYRLLSPPHQKILSILAVLDGSWTRETARSIAGASVGRKVLDDAISRLVAESFLEHETDTDGQSFFHMLRSIRQFALQKNRRSVVAAQARHLNSLFELVRSSEKELKGGDQEVWLNRFEDVHENIITAIRWGLASPKHRDRALDLAGLMRRFWFLRGHYATGCALLEEVLQHLGDQQPTRRGRTLLDLGILRRVQGELEVATGHLNDALGIFTKLHDDSGRAAVFNAMGILYCHSKKWDRAKASFDKALSLALETNDRNMTAWALNGLGNVAKQARDWEKARSYYEDSRQIKEELQDLRGVAMSSHKLGEVSMETGNLASAQRAFENALWIRQRLGYRAGVIESFNSLFQLAIAQGDFPAACNRMLDSLSICVQLGDRLQVAMGLLECAPLALRLADEGLARRQLSASIFLFDKLKAERPELAEELLRNLGEPSPDQGSDWRQTLDDTVDWLYEQIEPRAA
jgi:non-specific serine/threonine protein kinase